MWLIIKDEFLKPFKIIDFQVYGDSRVEERQKEKIEKYQYLRRKLQKLSAIPKQFRNTLEYIGITTEI